MAMMSLDSEINFKSPELEDRRGDKPVDDSSDLRSSSRIMRDRSPSPLRSSSRGFGTMRQPSPKLRSYSGEEDWDDFIEHFEVISELGKWDVRSMILTLRSCMTGRAQVFVTRLPGTTKDSYIRLVTALQTHFSSSKQQPVWVATLKGKTRSGNQSIQTFGEELSQLASKAYADLQPKAQERMALEQLYWSLSPELRFKCIERDCRTVEEAVGIVQMYEGIIGSACTENTVRKVTTSTSRNAPENRENEDLTTMMKQIMERIDKLETRPHRNYQSYQGYQRRECYKCKATDHLIRNCPLNRQDYRYNQNQAPAARADNAQGNGNPAVL